MTSVRRALSALFMLLILFSSAYHVHPALAQEDSDFPAPQGAEEILRSAGNALSTGDAEAFAAHYANDAVYVALPPPPETTGVFAGRDAILDLATGVSERNLQVEFVDVHVNGESATFTALITEDNFTAVGVAPIEFAGTATVQEGMIAAETLIMRPESLARLIAAENRALVQRLYDEIYNGRALDVLGELAAPEAMDAYQTSATGTLATFSNLTVTVEHLLVEGDYVVAVVTFVGTSAGGAPMTWTQIDIHRIVNGLLVEARRSGGPALSVE